MGDVAAFLVLVVVKKKDNVFGGRLFLKYVVNLVDKLKAYDGSSFQIIVVEKSITSYRSLYHSLFFIVGG